MPVKVILLDNSVQLDYLRVTIFVSNDMLKVSDKD